MNARALHFNAEAALGRGAPVATQRIETLYQVASYAVQLAARKGLGEGRTGGTLRISEELVTHPESLDVLLEEGAAFSETHRVTVELKQGAAFVASPAEGGHRVWCSLVWRLQ